MILLLIFLQIPVGIKSFFECQHQHDNLTEKGLLIAKLKPNYKANQKLLNNFPYCT